MTFVILGFAQDFINGKLMVFQTETSFEEIEIPPMMEKAARNSVGFLVAMTNIYINEDDTLSVKGSLPIFRIFENQDFNKEELIIRHQSYPLGISSTYTIPNSKRAEMNWNDLKVLPDKFRSACSLQYQASKTATTPFEDRINQRIWRFNESRFKNRMIELEKVSVSCQTWPEAKRKLEFLHLSPKLKESPDSDIIKPKKRRRIILSDDSEDEDRPAESTLFDFTPQQLEEMTEDIDVEVFNQDFNFLLQDAECDDKESEDEVMDEPNEEDANFLNDSVIIDDVFIGNCQYTEAQKEEFHLVRDSIINDETFKLKMITESDFLKIITQSSDGFLPIGMSCQFKQCLIGKVQADDQIKIFLQSLTEINFSF